MFFPSPEVLLSNSGSLNITLSLLETLVLQGSVQISHCCNCVMLSFGDFVDMHSHAGVAGVLPAPGKGACSVFWGGSRAEETSLCWTHTRSSDKIGFFCAEAGATVYVLVEEMDLVG